MESSFEELVDKESLQQAERLAFIDFRLRYLGEIARNDLIEEFKIGQATASNDLKLYKQFRPQNTDKNNAARTTVVAEGAFYPLIKLDTYTALEFVLHGFCRNELVTRTSYIPAESIDTLMVMDSLQESDIAAITRAIYSNSGIHCCYLSSSSDDHDERQLYPTAVFVDRKHWYFRAYDRNKDPEKSGFKNFKMTRVKSAQWLRNDKPMLHESMPKDEAWHTLLPLQISIHDKCKRETSLTREFGLVDGKKTIICKAAFAYFVRQNWKIDVGVDEKGYYNFKLDNSESLRQIQCAENLFR
ncbi:WYL domain-containing protein [Lelliottia wanjuensis]|uniref:WYL domain-containing protein n=1 Tax=Lelliottia wanjuensis TaxID=3050585 RepID=A0AAP4FXK8_9ENTR|nr:MULTISPECIES: WYL domain-containing protein [unclassified Lelliottia]MDK9365472.1 WYL domain-containing protein [Lelliottia sp. V106_12]MDK9587283.1 WYL domain-containing protein [Lelliottia sp. V86_10]MDK9615368.1 WYL domain-containing protein [Lelliottia sp. V106_9]